MLLDFIKIYRYYFLIALFVAILLSVSNFSNENNILNYILISLGSLLTPFLYELDYLIYAYLLDTDAPFSITLRNLLKAKRFRAAFLYAHENGAEMTFSIFRSVLVVLGVFGVAFILVFSPSPPLFSLGVVLSFLLTSLYLQISSLYTGTWKMWYSSFDTELKESYIKAIIILEVLIYIFFIFQVL